MNSKRLKEAYYHDALTIAEFKEEQHRHTRELAAAEAIVQQHLTSLEAIETGVDELLQLTNDPVAFYEAAPDDIKRMLLQAVFEKIWIADEQIVGVDLTRPIAGVLTVEAQLDLRDALSGTDSATVTYERRERLSWRSPEFRSLSATSGRTAYLPLIQEKPPTRKGRRFKLNQLGRADRI
jgi:hypothetical protein